MQKIYYYVGGLTVILILIFLLMSSVKQEVNEMSFFVTSVNSGKGADLGGLAGADNHCQALAQVAGVDNLEWRAYLSTIATENSLAINARDRIGKGPWKNFAGVTIAASLDDLHGANNNINKQTALTEKGAVINGRGDAPNLHDILTGSDMNGMAVSSTTDTTCGNWTKDGEGSAIVGHHDRLGLNETDEAKSWNSSHLSRGCGLDDLARSGGGGLFYCFAATK